MNGPEINALRGVYGPSVAELSKHLPDAAGAIAGSMAHLCRDPSRDGCERMLIKLEGLKRQVRELHLALQREE